MGLERTRVDHGAHEVLEVGGVAHTNGRDVGDELLLDLGPDVRRDVEARCRGALLPLVLEGAAHDGGCDGLGVGGRVREDEVLPAGLADETWIAAVAPGRDGLPDGLPHAVEDRGRTGEVDPREVRAGEGSAPDRRARAVDEVDDAVGKPGLLQHTHVVVRRERSGRRRLPHDRAAHERRRGGQVAADAAEVERADREDEALERPVLHPVPDPGGRVRLLGVDPEDVVDVVAPEVDHLADGVDLRLVRRLGLVEDRRSVQRRAPRPGKELGGSKEDGGALVPRHP